MKTEIVQRYDLDKNRKISRVLPINNIDFAVLTLTYQSDKPMLLIHGNYERRIELPDVKSYDELNGFCSLFKYKHGFGLAERFGRLFLCPNLNGDLKKVQIEQPYSKDEVLQPFLSGISYRALDDSFLLGIEDELSYFFPAKYWTRMKLKNKKVFGFNLPQLSPVLDELRVLEINKYPPTDRNYSDGEWLNIQTFGVDENKLLIHTNGGAATRSKSGPDFQFSIISEFDSNFRFIDNHKVEEGKVFFSVDKKFFIILSRNNKKLFVYDKDNIQLKFEVSLTSRQNLGTANPRFISIDIREDFLYIYGRDFLNICKLIK
ncbi:hypothetical protein QQ008_23115 [Fulvivirgaceae bacterium BMA10]|uniref:Uncharacterized protein n=1 Tax=Splendidivirga corallicola TaxID=3051826 RepID=A0ABT8KWH7_9BACT|nr:hypothetical protein [Fulvivirgaceae bacterium BMA10]